MTRTCTECTGEISRRNKTGLCKSCSGRRLMREGKIWALGRAAQDADPVYRQRASALWTQRRMGWCPEYLRPEYRRLKNHGFTGAERRAIVLAQYQRDMARVVIA